MADDKLRRAREAGLIDDAQLAAIEAMGAHDEFGAPDDEPFRLFGGFGEVLISIGLVVFLIALSRFGSLVLGGTALLLSVYFVRVRRLTFPGIVLVSTVFFAFMPWLTDAYGDTSAGSMALTSAIMLALFVGYYVVFRLPFALYPLAWSAAWLALSLLAMFYSERVVDSLEARHWLPQTIGGLIGLGALIIGLRYDFRDPSRQTADTQRAFWLHFFAAPFLLWPWVGRFLVIQTPTSAMIAGLGILLLALVGLALDRRSFVVAGLISFGILLAYFLPVGHADLWVVLMVVGGYAVLLGTFWRGVRRIVIGMLPPAIRVHLPKT